MSNEEMRNVEISADLYEVLVAEAIAHDMTETDVTEHALHELFFGDMIEENDG